MTTSSTRLRLSAALAVTTLGLFSLGGTAFAGDGKGQGEERKNDRAGAAKATETETKSETETETAKASPSEAKAEQFQEDQAAYDQKAAPSRHPSGNDRTEEAGGSGTQGKSTSDPDETTNGGVDKDGGKGGIFLGDQDGNNGCGNDQDFEDDNNGWCGKKPKPAKPTTPVVGGEQQVKCPEGETMPAGGTTADDCEKPVKTEEKEEDKVVTTEVLGGTLTGGTVAPEAVVGAQLQNLPEGVETRVLGVTIERGAAADNATAGTGTSVLGASFTRGSVLARTGFGLTLAGLVGLALVLVGAGLQRAGRKEHGPLA